MTESTDAKMHELQCLIRMVRPRKLQSRIATVLSEFLQSMITDIRSSIAEEQERGRSFAIPWREEADKKLSEEQTRMAEMMLNAMKGDK